MEIRHLYISPGHNYFGRHGLPPGEHETVDCQEILCEAGMGIKGDRFYGFKEDYKGQITFFSWETYLGLCEHFQVRDKSPSVFRRNVIVSDCDLVSLHHKEFTLQGIHFLGMGECTPCHWMDHAFHPGTENWLKGCGGLRAKILTSGRLTLGKI